MSLPAPRMSPPATRWRGSIDRRSGGREWGRPSPDLFASRGRRGRARPGRAFPDVDPVTLFAGGDTGGVADPLPLLQTSTDAAADPLGAYAGPHARRSAGGDLPGPAPAPPGRARGARPACGRGPDPRRPGRPR